MNDTNMIIAEPEKSRWDAFKGWVKINSINLGLAVGTLGLAGLLAYDQHKRNTRKEEKYTGYLETKLDLQREALGLYKDSLGLDDRPDHNDPDWKDELVTT